MMTFKKYSQSRNGQAVLEYFILFAVLAVLTLFIMSPKNPLSIDKVKTQLETAFDGALDKMGVK